MSEKTEKEALRDEIVAYTDELLSYAIKMDVDAIPNDPEQITEEYQNLLHRIIPKIGKIMTGINLLYFADESRASLHTSVIFHLLLHPFPRFTVDDCRDGVLHPHGSD